MGFENSEKSSVLIDDIFDAQQYEEILKGPIPEHVAIIMDGNRRWARAKGLNPVVGHYHGAENLISIVKAAAVLGVKVLTCYSFSTENWTRSGEEISALMELFGSYLLSQQQLMVDAGIKLEAIGDLSGLPKDLQQAFQKTSEATKNGQKIQLVLALNYGSRDEIKRSIIKILQENEREKIDQNEIDENFIKKFLDTSHLSDPDLLIRTSGEMRLSNFLLWQLSYAEFYISNVLWPDFSPQNLLEAVLSFQKRHRRKGGSI